MTTRNVRRKNTETLLGAATIAATLTMTGTAAAQQCVPGAINWIEQFGTADSDEANGVAVDGAGSSYVAGTTAGTLPGQSSASGVDAFVRKYDSDHNEAWTRQFGTSGDDRAFDVALDAIGNVYVSGSLASPTRRAFLRKYDAAGTEVWTREFGSPLAEAMSVAVDPTGSVYVAGVVLGVLPGQSAAGGLDAFVRKYSDAGVIAWTRQFGTAGIDQASSVSVGTDGNVSVTGSVGGTFPGESSSGGTDVFARQYDSSGLVMWTHQFGTAGDDTATAVAVDESGSTYVTSGVAGALPGESWQGGMFDAFIRKYDAAGGEAWTHQFGTPTGCANCFGFDLAWGVAVDDSATPTSQGRLAAHFLARHTMAEATRSSVSTTPAATKSLPCRAARRIQKLGTTSLVIAGVSTSSASRSVSSRSETRASIGTPSWRGFLHAT